MSTSTSSPAWVKASLAALPLYGVFIGYSTLKAQPDQIVDPGAWARFVSSPSYLAEHIASNVVGAVIAIFGTLALGALLASSRARALGEAAVAFALERGAAALEAYPFVSANPARGVARGQLGHLPRGGMTELHGPSRRRAIVRIDFDR
jgi:hypothetical protein